MIFEPIAVGRVEHLATNGGDMEYLFFGLEGPAKDKHSTPTRRINNHDGGYQRTSVLKKGAEVFNWRSWTAISREEISQVEKTLGCAIPPGCLLENLIISGVENFSKLPPATRLVFPWRQTGQLILAVWQENGPCRTSGMRLEKHHGVQHLATKFISAARGKRGVMGFVLSEGRAEVGDEVLVYAPL